MNDFFNHIKTLYFYFLTLQEYILRAIIMILPIFTIASLCLFILKISQVAPFNDPDVNILIWGPLFLLLVIGHVLNLAMGQNDEIYDRFANFMVARNQTLFSYLTLGLFNTFELELYYNGKSYTYGNQDLTSLFIFFPVINIIVYAYIISKLENKGYRFPFRQIMKLYLSGRLSGFLLGNEEYRIF